MANKHWSIKTFKVLERSDYGAKHGYCTVCYADMAQYNTMGLRHYNSHTHARSLGLWGKR